MEAFLWTIIWPHFYASYFRISNREEGERKYLFLRFGLPLLLLVIACSVCCWGRRVVPFYLLVGLLWRLYHGAAQSFGVGIIYAKRCGFLDSGWHRFGIAGLTYWGYAVITFKYPANFWPYTLNAWVVKPPHWLGFEQMVPWLWRISEWGFFGSCLLMTILCLAWCVRRRRVLNPLFLIPIFTPYLIMRESPQSTSYQIQSLYHALQYLFVVWALYTRADRAAGISGGALGRTLKKTVKLFASNFSGGALLYGILLVGAAALARGSLPWIVCYFVVALAIESHHFITDAFVWKVSNRRARASVLVST